ncbi:UDP-glucose dehydrogenase family protein, partial [Chloroflexota bacterium]
MVYHLFDERCIINITVIGAGYVGLTTACCLADLDHEVSCVENKEAKLKLLRDGVSPIEEHGISDLLKRGLSSGNLTFSPALPRPLQTGLVIVTVGTPSLSNGAADLTAIYQVSDELREVVQQPLTVVMKSSVPPGTGVKLIERYFQNTPILYVSNPEFLREGHAVEDWNHPSRVIIGAQYEKNVDAVRQIYSHMKAPILITDITSAETIKYAANAFLVTKISFINEIANLCETINANIDDVAKGMGLDPRIGLDFLRAGLGYGGSCFPKDVRALDFSALNKGHDLRLIKAAIEVNNKQRIIAVQKLKQLMGTLEGKEIALLGLAFKPKTDDIREAPSLDIANILYDENAKLRVYDPAAMGNAAPVLPPETVISRDIYDATTGAQAVLVVTEWEEFIQADWGAIKRKMKEPYLVFDGRNVLNQKKLKSLG